MSLYCKTITQVYTEPLSNTILIRWTVQTITRGDLFWVRANQRSGESISNNVHDWCERLEAAVVLLWSDGWRSLPIWHGVFCQSVRFTTDALKYTWANLMIVQQKETLSARSKRNPKVQWNRVHHRQTRDQSADYERQASKSAQQELSPFNLRTLVL